MSWFAQLLLGIALACNLYALPLHLAIPCGHSRTIHACVLLMFAVGAVIGLAVVRARAWVAAVAWILALVVERHYAHPLTNWGLEIAGLPFDGAIPLPLLLTASVFALPIGIAAAALFRSRFEPSAPLLLGCTVGLASAPLLACAALGIRGTLLLTTPMIALAALLRFDAHSKDSTAIHGDGGLSLVAAAWIGILHPIVVDGAGGTAVGGVLIPMFAAGGAALGLLVQISTPWMRAGARIAVVAVIFAIAGNLPSRPQLDLISHGIASESSGVLPTLEALWPLPAAVAFASCLLALSGALSQPRSWAWGLVVAILASLLPRGALESRLELAVLGTIGVGSVVFSLRRPLRDASTEVFPRIAVGFLACSIAAVHGVRTVSMFSSPGEAGVESGYESDGSRFDLRQSEEPFTRFERDGIALPIEGKDLDAQRSALRLMTQVLVYSDVPANCVVLGPGVGGVVAALDEVAVLELFIVTPLRGEWEAMRRDLVRRPRTHVIHAEPRAFLAATPRTFDRIVLASPQPAWREYGWNRTLELRQLVAKRLAPKGVAAELFALSAAQPANMVSRFVAEAMLAREEAILVLDHPRSALPWVAVLFGSGVERIRFSDLQSRLALAMGANEALARVGADARSVLQFCIADSRRFELDGRLPVRNRDDRPWIAASAHAWVEPNRGFAIAGLTLLARKRASIEARCEFQSSDADALRIRVRSDHDATTTFLNWRADHAAQCANDAADSPSTATELDAMLRLLALSPDLAWARIPLLRSIASLIRSGSRLEARLLLERLASAEREYAVRDAADPRNDPVVSRLALGRFLARSGHRGRAQREFESLPSGDHDRIVEFETLCLKAMGGRVEAEASIGPLTDWLADPSLAPEERSHAELALAFAKRDRAGLKQLLERSKPGSRGAAERYAQALLER